MLRRGGREGEIGGSEVAAIKKQTGVDDTPKVVRDSVVSYCFNNDADFPYFLFFIDEFTEQRYCEYCDGSST